MFHFVWAVAVSVLGTLIALDYRNLAVRVYDIIGRVAPGGPPGPRFTFDHLRVVWAILTVVAAVVAVVKGVTLFG
ncbi:hypothetical protein HTV45_02320 [Streptomyces sp. CHD11]|uniref:hypothetical protein n=1 Tax=Streptomyces sp. CHD11 TaxID=2741325 RepID=UPI001BFC5471|nr:hypothetical protein [Streptomyces sp. CHD11]MBT3149757.1 hypothetical protein [Streptomyces sp. CHD11]